MSHHVIGSARRRSRRLTWAASLLAIVASLLATSPLASASPPVTATVFTSVRAYTPSITVPDAPGATTTGGVAVPFIVAGTSFNVDFTTDAPLSTTRDVTVAVSLTSAPGTVLGSVSVPKNTSGGTISGLTLATPANGVGLTVAAVGDADVAPSTFAVDVLRTYVPGLAGAAVNGIGGGGGSGVACNPTAGDPTCGDLLPPANGALAGNPLLSQGECTTDCRKDSTGTAPGSVLQALFVGLYDQKSPATFIAKCDKTLCPGKGVKTYNVKVQLKPGQSLQTPDPCPAKGVVGTNQTFCVDYVQSTRDGAGDVKLYVLFTQDLKIIW